jgi:hypothetical protein
VRIIYARRLLKQFAITITETLVFKDLKTDKDGLLILDLRTTEPGQGKSLSS